MGKVPRKSLPFLIPGTDITTLTGLIDFLKSHILLQHCTEYQLGGASGTGKLIWARNPGSVYWPALIASLEDKPDQGPEQDSISPNAYRCVMFLETSFRFALLQWKDIIFVNEEKFDEQSDLIARLNRYVIRRSWREEKPYKEAVALLREFISLDVRQRQSHAFQLSLERKRIKEEEKAEKIRKSGGTVPVPKKRNTDDRSTGENGNEVKSRTSEKYKLRPLVLSEKSSGSECNGDKLDQISDITPSPSVVSETLSDISRKAKQRPKVGGAAMKEYAKTRFEYTDKSFKFLPNSGWKCAACLMDIEQGKQFMCHDLPHHAECLLRVTKNHKDGSFEHQMKCKVCVEQGCFICKNRAVAGEFHATKCSKCELRYHRTCLLSWPQAVVQGSTGPITCPVHFCHSCVGEHYVLRKIRNFKAFSGGKFRCLQCPATYHKPNCLPAGSGEHIFGKDFVICPRHTLTSLPITQRRFGCLTCGKNLKSSEERKVECSLCLQIFHPECIGYTSDHSEGNVSVQAFGAGYKCSSCFWGLFPLYGQVIWFQQPKNPFWPARILFPKESIGRYEFCKNRPPGQYSIKYFGPLQTYYDKTSRTFPLSLATVKLFTTVKVYHEENHQIKSAYDEAGFFSLLVDDLRDQILPAAEPFYRKIEKNIYRYSLGTTKKNQDEDDTQLECYCADDADAETVCTSNSGCHNRDTAVECNSNNCKGGDRCQNRMFSQKQKDAENTIQFLTQGKGWAVKAAHDFKEGDFIIEYCGEIISNSEMQYRANRKTEEDPLYILEIDKHTFIDAEFCGNVSRLINHSCEPNCRIEKYTSEGKPVVGVFAHQDITEGDELTFDYAYGNNSSAPFRCHCGTPSCKGFIGKQVTSVAELVEVDVINQDLEKYDKECAKCSFGGHVLCCDYEDCFKVYHKSCAGLSREPENDWYCPDHKVQPQIGKKRKATHRPRMPIKKILLKPAEPKRKIEPKKSPITTKLSPSRSCQLKKTKVVKSPLMRSAAATPASIPHQFPFKPNGLSNNVSSITVLPTLPTMDLSTSEKLESSSKSSIATTVTFEDSSVVMEVEEGQSNEGKKAENLTEGTLKTTTPRSERLAARRRLTSSLLVRPNPKLSDTDNQGVAVMEWLQKNHRQTLQQWQQNPNGLDRSIRQYGKISISSPVVEPTRDNEHKENPVPLRRLRSLSVSTATK